MSFGKASRDVYHMTGSDNPGSGDWVKPAMAWSTAKGTRASASRSRTQPLPKANLKRDPRHHRQSSKLTPDNLAQHLSAHGGRKYSILEHVVPGVTSPRPRKGTTYQHMTEDNESFKELEILPMDVINKPCRQDTDIPDKVTAAFDARRYQHESAYAAARRLEQKAAANQGNLNYLFGKE